MNCTDIKIRKLIGSYELGLLSKEERLMFENHLLECQTCFQNLYRIAPITNLIRDRKLAPSQKIDLQEEDDEAELSPPAKKSKPFRFLSKKWVFSAASVLSVLALILVIIWFQGPKGETERLRGHDDVSILVVSPVGVVTALKEIRWKPVAGVDSYDVKIYNEAGNLVWEGSAKKTYIFLPESVIEILFQGGAYFWQVEAQTEGGRLKSQMIRFWIRK
jgi:hypothetical protein